MTDSLSHLPVTPLAQVPRHVYGEARYVKADPAKGRPNNQTERACVCGVVKITVHGGEGGAWREWRLPGSPDQYSDAMGAPPCSSTGARS
jgi:hypothetical protein